jgi:uncharacterized protein (TIGR00299 family) protein
MKILYLDTFAGISGDMSLGLLVDLGLPLEELETELRKLPVAGWRLEERREKRLGIEGTRLEVHCDEEHHHRTWADIDRLLAASALSAEPRDMARRIFRRLGEAEAKVHGMALEKVHFHEVGAVDSIVDIVGAAIGIHRLGIEKIICAPLPLSHGMVQTAHGHFPLPAPATAELLRGLPVIDASSDKELVTPTGAAIVAEVAAFGPLPAMKLLRTGYGVGGWRLTDRPNLLRGLLGETGEKVELEREVVTVLETHLDDSTPEILGHLQERLLAAGALDAAFSPLQMKKNRPGVRLTVVAEAEREEELARLILRESSAIGVRHSSCQRLKLRRESSTVRTELGEAQVKLIYEGEKLLRVTPEYDSCRALADAAGKSLPEVMRLIERAADVFFKMREPDSR